MGGVSSVLKTEWNNICVANVSDQSARKYKENFSTEIEDQGSMYPVLKSSNTEYCFFRKFALQCVSLSWGIHVVYVT